MIEAARAAGLDEFIAGLPERYETVIGERGANLSGGQRQRLAIARALLRQPEILIFDEATSHLDTATERAIQVSLRTALAGKTVVLVAHRLSTIRDADLIYVLHQGRVVEAGDAPAVDAPGGAVLVALRSRPKRATSLRALAGPAGRRPRLGPPAFPIDRPIVSSDRTPDPEEMAMHNDFVLDLADCTDFRQALLARPPRIVHGTAGLLVVLLGIGAGLGGRDAGGPRRPGPGPGPARGHADEDHPGRPRRGPQRRRRRAGRRGERPRGGRGAAGRPADPAGDRPAGQRDRQAAAAAPGRGGGAGPSWTSSPG